MAGSAVVDWLRAHKPEIAVDPVILGELRFGILIFPKGKERRVVERWFDAGAGRLHCLSRDADAGLIWAEPLARFAKPAGFLRVHGLAFSTFKRFAEFFQVLYGAIDAPPSRYVRVGC